tara:strand:- start:26 stop:1105 length:1080 start_codon:yes stop_codon:yes gene_type:complete
MLEKTQLDDLHSELISLRTWLLSTVSYDDFKFLRKVEWIGRAATVFGYLLVGLFPSWFTVIISSFLISWGLVSRALLGHHCGHGAYDNIPGVPKRYHREFYGQGWRRYTQHFLLVEQKDFLKEHLLHHRTVNDPRDPDPVYMNHEHGAFVTPFSSFQKNILFWIQACVWVPLYYAPHFKGIDTANEGFKILFNFRELRIWKYWLFHAGPYALWYFVAIPSLFISLDSAIYVLAARLLTELWFSLGTFCIEITNHTGPDVLRFWDKPKTRSEWYWRQIVASVNFSSPGHVSDYLHFYMNYQIEHHIVPNLPMNKYCLAKPFVHSLCLRYGVPYTEETIWRRILRVKDCFVGDKRIPYYER